MSDLLKQYPKLFVYLICMELINFYIFWNLLEIKEFYVRTAVITCWIINTVFIIPSYHKEEQIFKNER